MLLTSWFSPFLPPTSRWTSATFSPDAEASDRWTQPQSGVGWRHSLPLTSPFTWYSADVVLFTPCGLDFRSNKKPLVFVRHLSVATSSCNQLGGPMIFWAFLFSCFSMAFLRRFAEELDLARRLFLWHNSSHQCAWKFLVRKGPNGFWHRNCARMNFWRCSEHIPAHSPDIEICKKTIAKTESCGHALSICTGGGRGGGRSFKDGKLKERRVVAMHGWQSEPTDGRKGGWGSGSVSLSLSPSLFVFIYPFARLSIDLSIYLDLFVYLDLSLSLCLYLPLSLSIYPSIYPSIHLSVCLSTCQSLYLSVSLSLYLSLYRSLSRCLSGCQSIYSLFLSMNLYLTFYLDVFLSLSQLPKSGSRPSVLKV